MSTKTREPDVAAADAPDRAGAREPAGAKPRALLLSASGAMGGAERVLLDIIGQLRSRVDFELVCLADGPLVAEAQARGAGTRVIELPPELAALGDSGAPAGQAVFKALAGALRSGRRLSGVLGAVNAVIRRFRPHVVHSNGFKTHLMSAWLVRGPAALIWHMHDLPEQRGVMRRVLPRACGGVAAVVAVSDAVAAQARRLLRGRRVVRIHNAVDLHRFSPGAGDGVALDALAGLPVQPDSLVRVGIVATYARWKGQDVLIRAVAGLPVEVRRAARFYIVGGPIYQTAGSQWSREQLLALARQCGVEDVVGLVPFQRDPAPVYRALDVVVHASTQPEPFGLTIVEGMACGRAVIVSAGGGAAELFEDGVSGIAVPPGSEAALTAAMGRLIRDSALRDRLGRAARERVAGRFGLERFGREIFALYAGVHAGRHSP